MLCFSNYNEQQILIAIVDLKTRRKNIIKTLKTQRKPTFLFQVDEAHLFVGTEGGKIEHWLIESEALTDVFDAHAKSEEGVSAIIPLKTRNYLVWGACQDEMAASELVATASLGSSEIRVWTLKVLQEALSLTPHIRIETSMSEGIRFLIEASETQIVAVDTHKTLKFYEFIDKEVKEAEEKKEKEEENITNGLRQLLDKYDADFSGRLNYEEAKNLFRELYESLGIAWVLDDDTLKQLFTMFDADNSG